MMIAPPIGASAKRKSIPKHINGYPQATISKQNEMNYPKG